VPPKPLIYGAGLGLGGGANVANAKDVAVAMPLFIIVAIIAGLVAFAMIGAGIVMVLRGGTGVTNLKVFGATLRTQSVGVVSVVCGLLLLLFVLGPLIQAVVDLAKL